MEKTRITFFLCLTFLLLVLAAVLRLAPFNPLATAELTVRDLFHQSGRQVPPNPRLIFLGIDDASRSIDPALDIEQTFGMKPDSPEAETLRLMGAQWPWSRATYARILDRLIGAGAKVVAFDLLLPSEGVGDEDLKAALERHRGRVVLGSNFVHDPANDQASYMAPSPSLLPTLQDRVDRVAFVNFWTDRDGIVRRTRFASTLEQAAHQQIAKGGSEAVPSFAALALQLAGYGDRVPAGRRDYALRFTGPPEVGFPAHSIYEIFVPDYWQRNFEGGAMFRDAIVVVGAQGNWQKDQLATPLGLMPGPELHLNAMNAALHGEFLRSPPAIAENLLLLFTGLAAGALSFHLRSPWLRFGCFAAANVLWFSVAFAAFDRGMLLPVLPPLILCNAIGLLGFVYDLSRARYERLRLRRTFERYLPPPMVADLIDHPGGDLDATLGGQVCAVTILFSDIRNFSRATAQMPAPVLVSQLNEYFTAMVDCVFRHGGTLDKFVGDAVMAVWGTLRSAGPVEDARRAARCALEMKVELERLNERWKAEKRPTFEIGIGINHGEVVAGNIGSPLRVDFTVMGDAVNLAWRLQEHSKRHRNSILIGESMVSLLAPEFALEELGRYQPDADRELPYASLLGPWAEHEKPR